MGEAKRRKENDANFGRVPKDARERGLVISVPMEIAGTSLTLKATRLDPQELRFSLLFWERLVWPFSRAIYLSNGPDEEFLTSAGVLSRPEYTFHGDIARGMALTQFQAFQDLDRIEPGAWALAQGDSSFLYAEGFAELGKGALVELHRAIPIPREDVPLAEILEFRERRRDELVHLRFQLESFAEEIERSEERTIELQKRISELDRACANLLTLGKEWQFPVYLSGLKVSLSLAPVKFLPALAGGLEIRGTLRTSYGQRRCRPRRRYKYSRNKRRLWASVSKTTIQPISLRVSLEYRTRLRTARHARSAKASRSYNVATWRPFTLCYGSSGCRSPMACVRWSASK